MWLSLHWTSFWVARIPSDPVWPAAVCCTPQEQLSGALGQLSSSQAEGVALQDELSALGEDMQALVRENQVSAVRRAGRRVVHPQNDQPMHKAARVKQVFTGTVAWVVHCYWCCSNAK